MGVLGQKLIQVIDSTVFYNINIKEKCITVLHYSNIFSMHILTSNIHINCLILWFTKAIVCCTGIISCIIPVDVFYSQHFSLLHKVPRLFFGPVDGWFW